MSMVVNADRTCSRPARRPSGRRLGFTLIEASMTMVIIGVGLVAMLELLAAGTSANVDGVHEMTGMNLAKSIRELTLKANFNDVIALNKSSFTPPVDSRLSAINGFDDWAQEIDVQPVSINKFTTNIVDPNPDVIRVTVKISHNGKQVCQTSWYRFRPVVQPS